ncbi:MAG: HAMP domain-containing protein [Lentisphaerae bacterium]|nr:HAMP domain-containing protein [Lentisphaerota bacterium]
MTSIRWKFVLTAVLCLALPLFALNRYTVSQFDRYTRQALELEMAGHAAMVADLYHQLVAPGHASTIVDGAQRFDRMLHTFATNAASRFAIIACDGSVPFDSADAAAPAINTAGPEIQSALYGHYGARWALTPDRHLVYFYVAAPIRDGRQVLGAVSVTRHTGPISSAIQVLSRSQRLALAAALLFATVFATVMAQSLTRPLRRLTAATRDYARGQAPPPPPVGGRDEIAELARAVDRMAHDLEARHRYNRDFVATTLHELRTPITAIRGAVEVLESGAIDKPEARARFLANLRFEADRLTRLAGELGELTRLDTEDLRERRTVIPYPACVRAIVERLLPTLPDPRATLDLDLPDDGITASLVPERIEQVLANLLENALRYTPTAGRVTLRVEPTTDNQILTTIADTGPGIAPTNLERIFDRFFTTEPKGVARDYGTGLGLAVAKAIVEQHHGRIWAENRPEGGARLCFTLPAA